jgi:gluconate 2-dehydrogenase gamma chain
MFCTLQREDWVRAGRISRRRFLTQALLGATVLAAPAAFARTISGEMPWLPGRAETPPAYPHLRYFTQAERACVDAITARLIPSDETGPGAREAGVIDFIDSQLAGAWGRGDRWYMRGPFAEGLETQGYQSEHPPAALYRAAIEALDAHCEGSLGAVFASLSETQQDEVLKAIDEEELELDGVSAKSFLDLVMENAVEGFFCDPIYGGNRDMVGWKLVGFPGARYDYRDFLDHNGAALDLDPVGLMGRPAWNPA